MITIYHPEGDKVIWGIKCNFKRIDEGELQESLDNGWFKSPLDFDKPKPKARAKRKVVKDE